MMPPLFSLSISATSHSHAHMIQFQQKRGDSMKHFAGQRILPAAKNIKQFESLLSSPYKYIVLLDSHIGQLQSLIALANKQQKKVLLHADLVQGLKGDEYAAQFLCQSIRPAGLISTRLPVIKEAKKKGLIAIQRLFLLDSQALKTSYRLLDTNRPDYIEVLPGIIPTIIKEIVTNTNIPTLAGGLIRTKEDVRQALAAGAVAVTTSEPKILHKE
jgi:glycerol uptake operon antiterminator